MDDPKKSILYSLNSDIVIFIKRIIGLIQICCAIIELNVLCVSEREREKESGEREWRERDRERERERVRESERDVKVIHVIENVKVFSPTLLVIYILR